MSDEDEGKRKAFSDFNGYLRNLINNQPKEFPEEEKEEIKKSVSSVESESEDDSIQSESEEDSFEKENIDVDSLVESKSGDSDSSVDINSVLGGNNNSKVPYENVKDEIESEEDSGNDSDSVIDNYLGDSTSGDSNDDNHYFDPLEEQLLYSSDVDSVSFDDLNNDSENDENPEEDGSFSVPQDKKKFSEVHGSKGKYMAGKSKKTLILSCLIGIFAILLISLEMRKIMDDRKTSKEKITNTDSVNTGDYNPDFGDYASRAHVADSKDQNVSDINYTESLLLTDDRTEYKKEEPPKYNPASNQTYSPSSVPASSSWSDAVESSIRYQGFNGSGPGNYIAMTGKENSIPVGYNGYNPMDNYDGAQSYIDGYNQLMNNLSGNAAGNSNQNNNRRNFNNGSYDKNASSSINYIPENSLYPGTVIHAVLVSGINTDYPGAITARVLNNVYDSKTGKNLLIPSGSILRGSYSSASIGIKRIQIAWTDLILNRDGKDYFVSLGSMIGVDRQGYSGIKGSLNDHAFAYVKAMGLSAMFSLLNSNVYKVTNAQKSQTKRQLIAESQDIANSLTDKILDRALVIEPTVTVKPGTLISVDVDKILTLVPFSKDIPTQRYIRKK